MNQNHSAVACVIFNKEKSRVILIKRRDVPVWVLPGGGIDPGETPENAAMREAYEEIGVKCHIKRLIGIYLPKNRLSKKTFLFELSAEEGVLATKTSETIGAEFYDIYDLPLMPPPYQYWIIDGIKVPEGAVQYSFVPGVTWLNFAKFLITHPIKVLRFILSRLGWHWNS